MRFGMTLANRGHDLHTKETRRVIDEVGPLAEGSLHLSQSRVGSTIFGNGGQSYPPPLIVSTVPVV
jgi:hypothetical protein